MRGFKSKNTAQALISGFRTYYNFIRPHTALNGSTPSQVAGIDLGLNRNRWLNLINLAIKNKDYKKTEKEKKGNFVVKIYDKDGNEINGKDEGFKTQFKYKSKAKRFIEFYKKLNPEFTYSLTPFL